jgi:predicted nuclease of predicted toxin-antitoxin system
MKLLFDQNLSFRLCGLLSDLFPDCEHVRRLGFERADDLTLWRYARDKGYAFVTLDADFAELAALFGAPPKVIWLRRGNQSTAATERLLRRHREAIERFASEPAACLELY